MSKFLNLINRSNYLLLDGAMGTMLMDAGLGSGDPPEAWNVTNPDKIRAVHRAYIAAGSRIILTNSFGGSRFRLKLHRLDTRVYELNKAAAEIALAEAKTAPDEIIVAGSIGPSGEIMQPIGGLSMERAIAGFAEQAQGLVDGGADVLWIETMSDLNEVQAAVNGVKSVTDLPVTATMSFDTNGHTMMGVSPVAALTAMKAIGVVATGANCGNGLADIIGVIEAMQAVNSDKILIAKSNAGIPVWINDELSYDGSPALMGSYASLIHHLGAKLIGGCCGSSPEHVAAMVTALEYFYSKKRIEKTSFKGRSRPRRRRHQ